MFAVFGLVGLATEIRRMFIYAVLGLIVMLGSQVFNGPISIPLFILSGIAFTVGIIMLIRFLQKFPIVFEEETLSSMGHTNHASR